jgi:chromosomal replication initiation ATPase DnaA
MNDMNDLWKRCQLALREESEPTWHAWLQGLIPQSYDGETLVLNAPSSVILDRVESRFLEMISVAATKAADHQVGIRLDLAPMATGASSTRTTTDVAPPGAEPTTRLAS